MGHEASGIVMDVGPGVTKLQKGDHVVGTWMIACGHCPECSRGWGYLCRTNQGGVHEGTLLDGTSRLQDRNGNKLKHNVFMSGLAEYMVLPE
jgi:Zn-dependent alcohol dehydrogenase